MKKMLFFLLVIGACPANASIISTTGPVVVIPAPISVMPGASVNVTDGQVFNEQQGITLSSPLNVDATAPGTYSAGSGPGGIIAGGTDISSYFVLFDSGGTAINYLAVNLTFSTPILGVIFAPATLDSSDAIVGNPGTTDPTGVSGRGQEAGDSTAISADGLTVTLIDKTLFPEDGIRIITASPASAITPEPGAWGLWGVGLVFVALLARHSRYLTLAR
jgi:hypothetical protein